MILLFASCVDVQHRLTKKYDIDKDTALTNLLHQSANDSVASWINAGLDYTGHLLFNEWEVDSCFVFSKDKTRAIGALLNQSINDATVDIIKLFYCEKRNGEWYFFLGENMVIPRKNYQADTSIPLSMDQLRQIARKHLLKGYYGHLWFFPFVFWTKEENFAEPFWGPESDKADYITWKGRKKNWIKGLSVGQNVPNPLIDTCEIPLYIPIEAANPKLEIYTKSGKRVMGKSILGVGAINVTFNAKDFESGKYVYYLSFSTRYGKETYGYRVMEVARDTTNR
ncbi:MAG: hypothetical protein ACWA6U_18225 [Breznakibacter sp.]